jgi:acetone carboxylase, beta subunit
VPAGTGAAVRNEKKWGQVLVSAAQPKQALCYLDVGGTFTDAFLVDEGGDFRIGKAPTTPDDISRGFFAAVEAALDAGGIAHADGFAEMKVFGYGSTTVLNALLTRRGEKTGLLITRGFENLLQIERGKQSWTEYDRTDRIHPLTHRHLDPLVPRSLVRGVTERVDATGRQVIPLYEHEVAPAVDALLDEGVSGIAICFLWSFLNPEHERSAAAIAAERIKQRGADCRVVTSFDTSPVIRELSRTNATVIEAYTSRLAHSAFTSIERGLTDRGFKGRLQIMQSSGGLAAPYNVKAVDTLHSGPVGALVGGRLLAEIYGWQNVITTDVGGTSFDIGLINRRQITTRRDPTAARMILGVPMIEVLSIGAGGGTMARIDPLTNRMQVGPDSAGAVPGPVCYGKGGKLPTVTDADLILGYLNPDYFAGGTIKVDVERVKEAIRSVLAEPLGLSVIEAADGIRQIIDTKMRTAMVGLVEARGLNMSSYHLLAAGGGGPTHCAGYTGKVPLAGVLMLPYSAAFSAFGSSAADYEHHYSRATNLIIPPDIDEGGKAAVAAKLAEVWAGLVEQAHRDMSVEGFDVAGVNLNPQVMVRYGRQLNDLVIGSHTLTPTGAPDLDRILDAFERKYEETYARAARFPQAGYHITDVALIASSPKVRPRIKEYELVSSRPDPEARKGSRLAYFANDWHDTEVYELSRLKAGNRIAGPAIVEDPTTTYVVPPDRAIEIDRFLSLWLKQT